MCTSSYCYCSTCSVCCTDSTFFTLCCPFLLTARFFLHNITSCIAAVLHVIDCYSCAMFHAHVDACFYWIVSNCTIAFKQPLLIYRLLFWLLITSALSLETIKVVLLSQVCATTYSCCQETHFVKKKSFSIEFHTYIWICYKNIKNNWPLASVWLPLT